jgi:hypothetical protein
MPSESDVESDSRKSLSPLVYSLVAEFLGSRRPRADTDLRSYQHKPAASGCVPSTNLLHSAAAMSRVRTAGGVDPTPTVPAWRSAPPPGPWLASGLWSRSTLSTAVGGVRLDYEDPAEAPPCWTSSARAADGSGLRSGSAASCRRARAQVSSRPVPGPVTSPRRSGRREFAVTESTQPEEAGLHVSSLFSGQCQA